jgi:hypothetical protein
VFFRAQAIDDRDMPGGSDVGDSTRHHFLSVARQDS